jgi:putative transposase
MREKFTELTDSEWQFIEKIISNKRQRWHNLRNITKAILSIVWTGVQWRSLDSKYPPWQSVYYYFNKCKDGYF